ncbi:AraC family transcriptional regulator N-terminal domain-containing protein [Pseudomonas chlororaphis subsp. aurantiaca]|uniref:AraC family transcriptional regulator n=1 Tax=Pseudomonas chlororaphis TaxID=587753 RepID=UPI00124956A7
MTGHRRLARKPDGRKGQDIRFLRSNRPLTRTPVLYDPGIVILCQGRKRGYLGDDVYVYDAQHYLVVSVPVPFAMETDASEAEPMLAVYMRLDLQVASELMLQVDEVLGPSDAEPKGMYASPMDDLLRASTLRFLEAMSTPGDAQILGSSLVREIYYRILTGEQGGSMRVALNRQGHFGKVTRAIRKIHSCYQERLDVESLAQEASMSVPSFAMSASTAAFNVGYESASQFSREFKRFFGRTPLAEIEWMKATYALPAPSTPSVYVSSH